jgi:hypothetical protein
MSWPAGVIFPYAPYAEQKRKIGTGITVYLERGRGSNRMLWHLVQVTIAVSTFEGSDEAV